MPELVGETRERNYSVRKSGRSLVIEYEKQYYVLADSVDQAEGDIYNTPGLPVVFQSIDGVAVAVGQVADADPENPRWWTVTVEFSSELDEDSSGAGGQNQNFGDPTQWVPVAEFAFETYTEVAVTDAAGNPTVNSANQPYETGIAQKRTITRFDFDQFEPATTTIDEISERNETLNDTTFLEKSAKTLLLTIRKATIGYYFGFRVWRIGYSLAYKKDDWRVKRLDTGLIDKNGDPRKDSEGNRIVGALDGSGNFKADNLSPAINEFDQFATSTFADFLRVQNLQA